MKFKFDHFWHRIEGILVLDTDSPLERRRKVTLFVIAFLSCLTGLITGTRSYLISRPIHEVIIPYTFTSVVGIAIIIYFFKKKDTILLYSFLIMILFVPFVFQLRVGGYSGPGSVDIIFWSILAPFGALMFLNVKKAIYWFFAYLTLVILSFWLDKYVIHMTVTGSYNQLIFGKINHIVLLSITILITMMYFVFAFQKERERAEELVNKLKKSNNELNLTVKELKATQAELVQSEKMAALGKLVAGVVHEINTPLGAMNSTIDVFSRSVNKIQGIFNKSTTLEEIKNNPNWQISINALQDNKPVALAASERMMRIIKSLKNFSRLDEAMFQKTDIHEGLESTLTLLEHEFKDKIEVVKEYGDVPNIMCYPGELNQVFMNLLTNAIQAIQGKGTISIQTFTAEENIQIMIQDTGSGISKQKMQNLFEPDFSKKGQRVKAGFGLFTSYQIIKKHQGQIEVKSEVGQGSSFTVILPI